MSLKPRPWLKPVLEFGPLAAFLAAYVALQGRSFTIGTTDYSGFLIVTAAFIPVFLAATAMLWALNQRLSRVQVFATAMLVILGGLGLWFNDPRLIKMKPTLIYGTLASTLGIGLLLGRSWLKLIMEETIALRREGWMILTRRVTVLFALSAAANEIVWRTQSERFWVIFETLVMPLIIAGFFLAQIGLYVTYARLPKKKRKRKHPGEEQPQAAGQAIRRKGGT